MITTTICSHEVSFEYEDGFNGIDGEVPESEHDHVQDLITGNYSQGELCFVDNKEVEHRGWWNILK